MRSARVLLLSLALTVGAAVAPQASHAQSWAPTLEAGTELYLRGKQEKNELKVSAALQSIIQTLFAQQSIAQQSHEMPSELLQGVWSESDIQDYLKRVRHLENLMARWPQFESALWQTLQKFWEGKALAYNSPYHLDRRAVSDAREVASQMATGALFLAIPSSWMGLGGATSAAWVKFDRIRLLLAGVASAGGIHGVYHRLKGRSNFPPSPAELVTLAHRDRQDFRWEEAQEHLEDSWRTSGALVASTAGLGFGYSRMVQGLGGLRTLVAGSAAGAETGGAVVTAGSAGVGALVIGSIAATSYFVSESIDEHTRQKREQELGTAFARALHSAARMERTTTPTRQQLAGSLALMQAVGRLEAFHYRELLVREADILIQKSRQLLEPAAQLIDGKIITLEGLKEAALTTADSFWKGRFTDSSSTQSLSRLRALEGVSKLETDPQDARELILESTLNSEKKAQLLAVLDQYQNALSVGQLELLFWGKRSSAVQARAQDQADDATTAFRRWIKAQHNQELKTISSRLTQRLNDSDDMMLFGLSDPATVLFEVAAWLLTSPASVEQEWGSDLLQRAEQYIEVRNFLSGEVIK